MNRHRFLISAARMIAVLPAVVLAASLAFAAPGPTTFSTPDEAVEALVEAARADRTGEMIVILGPGSKDLVMSGDDVADIAGRRKFVAAYDIRHALEPGGEKGCLVLSIGEDNWPMPIPLVQKGGAWSFDISRGRTEILNRRIGRNELRTLEVIDAYVDAQHEYATKDCRGAGRVEFAQKFVSSPGTHDGLYWPAGQGEPESPLGPLLAQAAKEGYENESALSPFHGYYFRILTAQGKNAAGGPYSYIAKDRMILGFALVAYPASYGNSGIMTFLVNQEGVIYEKNLGKNTRKIAESMKAYNPDKTWKKVEGAAASR